MNSLRNFFAAGLLLCSITSLSYASSITLNQLFIVHKGLGAGNSAALMHITITPGPIARIINANIQFYKADCKTLADPVRIGIGVGGGSFTFSSGDTVSLNTRSLYSLIQNAGITNPSIVGCVAIQLLGGNFSGPLNGNPGQPCPSFAESCSGSSCTSSTAIQPITFKAGFPFCSLTL
jgi:hypothetical protein